MSSSISLHSGHVNKLRLVAVALVGLTIGACAVAAALASDGLVGAAASTEDLRQSEQLIRSALRDDQDLPDAAAMPPKLQQAPRWSSTGQDKRLLVSANIRYRGLTNSYCRLVTVSADLKSADLVPLPASANAEDCQGIASVLYLDINGDGIVDIVQGVRIKSNRYDSAATVPVVYLSSAGAKGGYCYSQRASREMPADSLLSVADASQALEQGRARLGLMHFDCSTSSK